MPTTQYLLNQLKKNAPVVYEKVASRRRFEITERIRELDFLISSDSTSPDQKPALQKEHDMLGEELALYPTASGDLETPAPTARKTV